MGPIGYPKMSEIKYDYSLCNSPEERSSREEQCMYEHNNEAHLHNNSCHAKPRGTTHSGCVFVDLVIQHAKCMHHILSSSVTCLVQPYFSTLSCK